MTPAMKATAIATAVAVLLAIVIAPKFGIVGLGQ
jgi:hypothetical protein